MGELLDRAYQREILQTLADGYPQWSDIRRSFEPRGNALAVNLFYLNEHGLLSLTTHKTLAEGDVPVSAKISAQGLDFIQGDGGLGAILGVVTVKIHEDTLRQLLISKVNDSEEDDGVKAKVIAKLKELPADALSGMATKAIDAGLSGMPGVAGWLLSLIPG